MKIPQLARYNGTVVKAYEFVNKNVTTFPIDPFELVSDFKWGLLTYEQMALKENCTIDDICECLGTDGFSIYNGYNYTIAYNNKITSKGRINFTIAHEIGHIILDHHKDFDVTSVLKDNFTKEEYKILENEANCFARNMLAPAPLIKKIGFKDILFDIPNFFNITLGAATSRISFLKNDLYYLNDDQVNIFNSKYKRYKKCNKCKTKYLSEFATYCPICGKKLVFGDGFMIYKDNFKLNKNGELTKCPVCHNEEISDGEYCKICGTYLINRCSNFIEDEWGLQKDGCGKLADINARYCIHCGCKTTFFNSGFLNDYKDYDIKQESLNVIWEDFLQKLKTDGKIMLYTNLINSHIKEPREGVITIYFDSLTSFSKTILTKTDNISIIRDYFNEIYDKNLSINIYDKSLTKYIYEEDLLPF